MLDLPVSKLFPNTVKICGCCCVKQEVEDDLDEDSDEELNSSPALQPETGGSQVTQHKQLEKKEYFLPKDKRNDVKRIDNKLNQIIQDLGVKYKGTHVLRHATKCYEHN